MKTTKTISRVCESGCNGTGVYSGFAEAKGVAVICLGCEGTGKEQVVYTPFKTRKVARGIKTVQNSRGTFLVTGVGPTGESVTYAQFKAGVLPGRTKTKTRSRAGKAKS